METKSQKLKSILRVLVPRVIACSGGLDSLLLSVIAARGDPGRTLIAHAASAAVPRQATERLHAYASSEQWRVELVCPGEFGDPDYLRNPVNRCFYCKDHLYRELGRYCFVSEGTFKVAENKAEGSACFVLSGSNVDDLAEYRPGLEAAAKNGVRHPFIEAGMTKEDLRGLARSMGLDFSEIPASPCLSSRIYTGTEITEERLLLADQLETEIKKITGVQVVRCRIWGDKVFIEVPAADRSRIPESG